MIYPIVEYAHSIGKNTADFTTMDMVNFNKWWMKQPNKEIVESQIRGQIYRAKQIHDDMVLNRKEDKMGKKSNKYKDAMTNRLSSDQVVDVEQADDFIAQEMSEVVAEEVVCSMELTKVDVDALLFALTRVFEDYNMEGHEYGASLASLKEGLEGV